MGKIPWKTLGRARPRQGQLEENIGNSGKGSAQAEAMKQMGDSGNGSAWQRQWEKWKQPKGISLNSCLPGCTAGGHETA
eukprot:1159528-Pelagomonas_calceolata.AAC.4